MSTTVIPAQALPVLLTGPKAPLWWAFVLMLGIESVVFGGLITSYFYLKQASSNWPPAGLDHPELLLPTLNTLVLIASSAAMFYGDRSIKRGSQTGLKIGQTTALVLALVFLTVKYIEYSGLPYDWSTHAYGSMVWTMSGFHAAHVMTVVLKGLVVEALVWKGYFTPQRRLGVQVNGLYWHFVVVVWIPLYFTIYWSPRLF
ncbi:hypothetical protein BH24GEM1_BH24GEM1_18300 [soil metagenome]